MSSTVIELDGVGKRYRLGEHHGSGTDLRETLARLGGRLLGRPRPDERDFWSLRDVTFDVDEGQAIGIIGANGAGKSTLLKIVSNITTPTEGRCRTRGKIGSLLEVGTGFHGELTGVENTYLNGAILGMTRRQVKRRLDEIIEFAGLASFMDTPVKRYSSGMYLRLGFSIAAHLEADILVVDEVLAVGDAEFQRRCLGKMSEVEQSGRTVLFVSHNLDALVRLCPTAVWLEHGTVRDIGPAAAVVARYSRTTTSPEAATVLTADDPRSAASVTMVAVVDEAGVAQSVLIGATLANLAIDVVVREPYPGFDLAVVIADSTGTTILDESLSDSGEHHGISATGRYRLHCPIPPILSPGIYTVTLWLGSMYEDGQLYERVLSFSIEGESSKRRVVHLGTAWRTEVLTSADDQRA